MKRQVNVSIVSANYNKAIYLEDFFQSIVNSTVIPLELILVEDGSNDMSGIIIKKFSYLTYLKVIAHEHNRGIAVSLNEGLQMAKGKYIMRLDTDDLITRERIETQYDFLEQNENVDIVGSNVFYYNHELGDTVYRSKFPLTNEYIYRDYRNGYHGLVHSSIMGKSSVLKRFEYTQQYAPAEEYDYFSKMVIRNVNMANIKEPLTYNRIHKENASFEKAKLAISITLSRRASLFRMPHNKFGAWTRIYHQYFYRRALLSRGELQRLFLMAISVIFSPGKLLKRLL